MLLIVGGALVSTLTFIVGLVIGMVYGARFAERILEREGRLIPKTPPAVASRLDE